MAGIGDRRIVSLIRKLNVRIREVRIIVAERSNHDLFTRDLYDTLNEMMSELDEHHHRFFNREGNK